MMKTLIVIDMQNDFVTGALGTPEAIAIVPKIKAKIEEYLKNGDQVVFTQDTHSENYLNTQEGQYLPVEHCIIGTNGWKIVKELDRDSCTHIIKHSFGSQNLSMYANGDVELVGVCTGICVISNAVILKAAYPEKKITIDASCCACVTPESHQTALNAMKLLQMDIVNE